MKVKCRFRGLVCGVLSAILAAFAITAHADDQLLHDKDAIERLSIEYAYAIDAADFDAVAGLFAEDGVWDLLDRRLEGHDQIIEFGGGWARRNRQGVTQRMVVDNLLIDIRDDNTATGRAYLTLYAFKQAPAISDSLEPVFFSIAEDEYVHTGEGWKFKSRKIIDSAKKAPTPD